MRRVTMFVALAEAQHHVINPPHSLALSTMASRTGCTSVGDRLMMPSTLGGRRLMLQGFAQFGVAFLDFLEQPHVLNCDDRLCGEGFEESDLLFGEGADFLSSNMDLTDRDRLHAGVVPPTRFRHRS